MLTPVSKDLLFKGRPGDPRIGAWVETTTDFPEKKDKRPLILLYGCPDDTGVLLNKGRAGAKHGPDSIRKYLYKMTLPMDLEIEDLIQFVDLGNITISPNILETHRLAQDLAKKISASNATLIALGGGHDFAAPNFMGWAEGLPPKSKKGLLNIDPHLDLRPLEGGKPHSGSPFRQILESGLLHGNRFVEFGVRSGRNARQHYQYALQKHVTLLTLEELREKKSRITDEYLKAQNTLSKRSDHLAITIDMDSYMEGEGSSAAPVLGFRAEELYTIATLAGKNRKFSYFEIAEVAPSLDPQERTSRLSAELVFSFLYSRAKSLKMR